MTPSWPRLLAAILAIHAVLALPIAQGWSGGAMLIVAAELPVLILALACLGVAARVAATVVLWLLALQKLADLVMAHVLGRPFDAVADLPLVRAGWDLVSGAFGTPAAVAAAAVAVALACGLAAGLWWACGILAGLRPRQAILPVTGLAVLAAIPLAMGFPGARNCAYAVRKIAEARQTLADLQDLRAAGAHDPFVGTPGLLEAIDRDVIVIFVESYGRASFDAPLHASRHLATLQRAQARLGAAGLAMRSGFVAAPTQGGQSWLSHATFASGLWIDDQMRYRAVLASGRAGLFHHARRAGFRTAAVMPAITRPWPESRSMGFDRILAAADLGYRGKPFNWVTMPDQFTLAATDRLLRAGPGQPRLFAQVALISSHAPWVPVPRLLDWDRLGDGRVFDAMAAEGDPPAVVWRDPDRVRRHYRDALDYSLNTVADYALRHAADPPLLIVLGDHQASPEIALDDRRDTVLHLIGPAHLVDRAARWGLACGLIPPGGSMPLPMDRLRDLILGSFGKDGPRDRPVATPC
ncbi:sulfatase [Paracoccus benzoatiresistens]|uniref:Sulfatase n=1 Tax=Paracoccus benzoatiresistens TaxID=2997341 RepID=A0ABT4IZ38_9RHOB|nr:sulfatase [Paracoccus sp. EF6]MCZ0960118.1 sulfatase [Paracoccus sp. EF6]